MKYQKVLEFEPGCAMAYWGISAGPNSCPAPFRSGRQGRVRRRL